MADRETEWSTLMRAANAGDKQAYAELLNDVTPVLRKIVRNRARTQQTEDHEDILQDVLIAIHTKRHTWNSDSLFLPWIYAITRYKVIDSYRKKSINACLPIEDFENSLESFSGDPTAGHDNRTLLKMLDERSASIVWGISIEGETAAEVGQRLSMSEGSVRVVLHRAMTRLRDLVSGNSQ